VFAMARKCVHSPNLFCYVFGEFTPKSQTKSISHIVKKAYELYFGCKGGDQTRAVRHIHVALMFAIFTWLAHWHSPINAFPVPMDGSSYRLLLLFNKNIWP